MSVDLSKFLPMFFQETEEHLASMEKHLLQLDATQPDAEVINSILRAAHSVKGNATIFGATQFSDLMHRIETVVELIRDEQLKLDKEVQGLLLAACDCVRDELGKVRDGKETDTAALTAIHDKLSRLAHSDEPTATETAIDADEHAPRRNQRFRVEVRLERGEDITVLPLAQLYGELATLGRVEDLQTGSGKADEPALALFLLTQESKKTLRAKLAALLGEERVRIESHKLVRKALRSAPARAANAGDDSAYGLFTSGSASTQTSWETTQFGRRAADAAAASNLGRRSTDRVTLDRASIRVDIVKVDRLLNLVGELVIAHSMLTEAAAQSGALRNAALRDSVTYVGRQTRDLQDAVMSIRLLPIDVLLSRMPRLVHDLAQRLGKEVTLETSGGETELDKEMIEKLADPLTHLIRNSIDHGIEAPDDREAAGKPRAGVLSIHATHRGGDIVIEVRDDGAGFDRAKIMRKAEECGLHVSNTMTDEEIWQLVFTPGFSTADEVSDVSGRGIGMDVAKRNIQALGGRIDVQSKLGHGTTIFIRLPLTLAIMEGMSVEVSGETFIIPLSFIAEAILPRDDQLKSLSAGPQVLKLRDQYLPVIELESLIGIPRRGLPAAERISVVLTVDGRSAAMGVDRLLGQRQVVIKNLEDNYRRVPGIGGATVLGNGKVALILDINNLLRIALSDAARTVEA